MAAIAPRPARLLRTDSRGVPTAEEERALFDRLRAGDRSARDELAERNLGLVAAQVARLRIRPDQADDLIQEGSLGLLTAIDRFDPSRGCRLSTYAVPWIRQRVLLYLAMNAHLVRLPAWISRDGGDADHGDRRIAGAAARVRRGIASLDARPGPGAGAPRADQLADARPAPDDELAEAEARSATLALLDGLPGKERAVILDRYLAGGPDARRLAPLAAVGRRVGVTAERVRQLEMQALGRLRARAVDLEPAP